MTAMAMAAMAKVMATGMERATAKVTDMGMPKVTVTAKVAAKVTVRATVTTRATAIVTATVKGFSTAEIGRVRGTFEGTVKAQTNAIYRKAGVRGRAQLLCLFIDDLVQEDLLPARTDHASGRPSP